MKVVFAIDGRGQSSEIARMLQLAIKTCKINTTHTPIVMADVFQDSFHCWLKEMEVETISVESPIKEAVVAANHRSGYPLQAVGNYIRYEACNHISDEYFIYCDCDTIFLRDFNVLERPALVAAVAEDQLDDWRRFNTGVLLVNRDAMRRDLAAFYDFAREKLEYFYPGFDQAAFNAFFVGRVERLSPNLNWRPYWGGNSEAAIIHTHGVKPSVASKMLEGIYVADHSKKEQITDLVVRTMQYLPSFCDCLLDFADDPVAKSWLKLSDSVKAASDAPLKELFARLEAVRHDVVSEWEAIELDAISKAMSCENVKDFQVFLSADDTDLRFVIDSKSLLVGLSDLVDLDNGTTLSISSCMLGNVASRVEIAVGGRTYHILRKHKSDHPVDVVFNLREVERSQKSYMMSIIKHHVTNIKKYWSRNGLFSEREAENIGSIPEDGS